MSTQLEMQLKVTTVKKAAKKAYEQMPERFSALTFCLTVRKILNKMTMDGTILRRLRELRESGECPYKAIDPVNAIYMKL